jgi:hypothetical protein
MNYVRFSSAWRHVIHQTYGRQEAPLNLDGRFWRIRLACTYVAAAVLALADYQNLRERRWTGIPFGWTVSLVLLIVIQHMLAARARQPRRHESVAERESEEKDSF